MIWKARWSILSLTVLAVATEFIEPHISHLEMFSIVYVGVFSAAISIFLVFRFNESYERWWEARKLWGDLVNASRDLGRQSLTILTPEESRSEAPKLIHRQIVFAHVMRIRLREGKSSNGLEQTERELRRVLPDEADSLLGLDNIPGGLLQKQSEQIATLLRGRSDILLTQFDSTLGRLTEVQGALERIKNTAFPDSVSRLTRALVWGLAVLLLLATVGPDGYGGLLGTIVVCVMAMGYIWIDAMGRDLKDPFDGTANDTPMTSLTVAIERDLREMLGETDLPEPITPVRGVLM